MIIHPVIITTLQPMNVEEVGLHGFRPWIYVLCLQPETLASHEIGVAEETHICVCVCVCVCVWKFHSEL